MKNKRNLVIFCLIVLLCAVFITCQNPIMEKWWEEAVNIIIVPERSGENFAVIVFNADGGVAEDGSVPQPLRVLWGNKIPRIRALTKGADYGFAGWMDESGKLWDMDTRTVKREDDVNKDGFITLTAMWSTVKYNVTFNTNFPSPSTPVNPSISVNTQIIARGGKVIEPSVIPTGDGHGLVGWYVGPPGAYDPNDEGGTHGWGKKWDFANDVVTENVTLFARWSRYTRTVHLQVNGGTRPDGSILNRVNFTIFTGLDGEVGGVIIDPGPLVRDGYTFGGWYTSMAFADEWEFSRKIYEVDTDYEGRFRYDPFTLYAKWVANIYTVTLNAKEGSPTLSTQAVAHGERVIKPNISGSAGRVIEGWYMLDGLNNSGNWGTKWDFDTSVVVKSITLYAKWEDAAYEVRFHLGSPPVTEYTLPSPMLPKPDNQFVIHGHKIIEPFMPQRTPPPLPAEATSWSFYRWVYHPTITSVPADINASGFRSGLVPWDFDDPVVNTLLLDGGTVFNLYAEWIPPVPGMIWIPRGSFIMGESGVSGSPAILHAYPTRVVTVDGFYMNRTLVTQENYRELMLATTSPAPPTSPDYRVSIRGNSVSPSNTNGANNPVERVSWFDAIYYCELLTEKWNTSNTNQLTKVYTITGSATAVNIPPTSTLNSLPSATYTMNWNASGYRLPTEAEWEYAAKGGNGMGPYLTYSGNNNANLVAWYNESVKTRPPGNQATQSVGILAPNNLGIYDMNGNVSEWCWDVLASYKDITASTLNPAKGTNLPLSLAANTTSERIRRGGAWSNTMANVRTVVRNSDTPNTAHWAIGIRVVRGPIDSEIW